jgi:hypothetical protein
LRCGNQEAVINFEANELKKTRAIFWATPDSALDMRVEEHLYRLERDEVKMLARLNKANLLATGVDKFLNKGGKDGSIDTVVDKKRVFISKKVIS